MINNYNTNLTKMDNINLISIVLEAVVVIISLMIALNKKMAYGWFIAFTFLIYVFYDLVRIKGWQIQSDIMTLCFLAATISAVIAVYSIYKKLKI